MDILQMAGDFLPEGALESVAQSAGVDTTMVGTILQHAGPTMAGALGDKMQQDASFLEKAVNGAHGGGLLDMVLGSQVYIKI